MTDATRLWLVERFYDDRNLVNLLYATTDGERVLRKQFSAESLRRRDDGVTASVTDDGANLQPSAAENRDRYADEATRMADEHDPDDAI